MSDRPSRSDDLDPEHSNRFDDASREGPLGHERIASELRKAAETFHPDDERIRQLINARTGGSGPFRTDGPVPVIRHLSPARRLMWPVAGSAAAAAVILAVFAQGALPGAVGGVDVTGPASGSGSGSATISVAGAPESGSSSSSDTTTETSGSPSPTTSPPSTQGVSPRPTSRTTPQAGNAADTSAPSGSTSTNRPGTTTSRAATATETATTTRLSVGPLDVSVSVRPVPAGLTADVAKAGSTDKQEWIAASENGGSSQQLTTNSSSLLGPVQGMGNGAWATVPGPFTVRRPDKATGLTVSSTTWVTVPGAVDGVAAGLRLPVRPQAHPATVTLYVGTAGGPGRLSLKLQDGATPEASGQISLPSCGTTTCPAIVTMTVSAATPGAAPAGETIFVDLSAVAPGGRVGFAAASMR